MKKISIVIAAAALVAAALPSPAQSRCHGCGAAAIIGGIAAGAIIGSAIANSGPGYYAGPEPVYEEGPPPPPRASITIRSKRRSAMSNIGRSGCPAMAGSRAAWKSATSLRAQNHRRNAHRTMCASTAAVGQQSTFNLFAF